MKLWHKFTDKTPEHYKELVIRENRYGIYEYDSAMAVDEYDPLHQKYYTSVKCKPDYTDGMSKHYFSVEMTDSFRTDKSPNVEWCYLEDLCRLTEKPND